MWFYNIIIDIWVTTVKLIYFILFSIFLASNSYCDMFKKSASAIFVRVFIYFALFS